MTFAGLVRHRRLLATHHSRDLSFLRVITAEMATASTSPWKCRFCRRTHTWSAETCPNCHYQWQDCYDAAFVHVPPPKANRREKGKQPKPRSQSPRQRSGSNQWQDWDNWEYQWPMQPLPKGGKAHGKAPGKAPAKGKGREDKGKGKALDFWEPPWTSPLPTPETTLVASSPSDLHLRALTQALSKEANLSMETQQLLQTVNASKAASTTRELHSAVSKLGNAKEQVHQAKLARMQLHSRWKKFLEAAVDRWKGYVDHYIKEDAQLEAAITEATSNLRTARKNLLSSRDKVAEKSDITDGGEISDEELLPDAAQPLTADLNKVVASLTVLKERAEAVCAEESASKRFKAESGAPLEVKTETDTAHGSRPAASTPSLEAFGGQVQPHFVKADA